MWQDYKVIREQVCLHVVGIHFEIFIYLLYFREQETRSAVVQFETESAAKTALLLTNALIVDRPITVVPYTSVPSTQQSATGATVNVVPPSPGTPVAQHEITQRDFQGVPDDQRVRVCYSFVCDLFCSALQC